VIEGTTISTAEINRTESVTITFDITDAEGYDHTKVELIELSINGPYGAVNVSLDNSSVPYIGDHREYVFSSTRTSVLGTYYVSIRANDTEGREVFISGFSFIIRNNLPEIVGFNYTCADPTDYIWSGSERGIYRNINDSTDQDPMIFYVNITDVEDSWIGNKMTDGITPYILIYHEGYYSSMINGVSDPLEPIRLNLTNLYEGNDSNGHIETWTTQYQFNDTINGYTYYAGELVFQIYIEDSDGATDYKEANDGFENTAIQDWIEIDNLVIKNYPLTANYVQLNNSQEGIEMTSPNWYYFKNNYSKEEGVKFFLFVDDEEGVSKISISFDALVGNARKPNGKVIEFLATGTYKWNKTVIDGNETYICTIAYEDLPDDTVAIFWPKITVIDTDHTFKSDTEHGRTILTTGVIQTTIELTGVSIPPKPPNVVYIFIIIGLVAVAVIAVVGIIIYRRKSGWRKYL